MKTLYLLCYSSLIVQIPHDKKEAAPLLRKQWGCSKKFALHPQKIYKHEYQSDAEKHQSEGQASLDNTVIFLKVLILIKQRLHIILARRSSSLLFVSGKSKEQSKLLNAV